MLTEKQKAELLKYVTEISNPTESRELEAIGETVVSFTEGKTRYQAFFKMSTGDLTSLLEIGRL